MSLDFPFVRLFGVRSKVPAVTVTVFKYRNKIGKIAILREIYLDKNI
jgi:hypothetical protein